MQRRSTALFVVVSVLLVLASCSAATVPLGTSDTASGTELPADAQVLVDAAAVAMGDVTSAEFRLERTGSPVFVDPFEAVALNELVGQFAVPTRAQALLTVEVGGNLTTQLGAVAIDETVWLSNPVTGDFEPLPEGYDLDPSKFFDPTDGWQPLLTNLDDVRLVGRGDNGDDSYHLRGTAGADDVAEITVGLIRNQAVPVDLWIDPVSALVRRAEFITTIDGEETRWALTLGRYGETFRIEAPEGAT